MKVAAAEKQPNYQFPETLEERNPIKPIKSTDVIKKKTKKEKGMPEKVKQKEPKKGQTKK